MKTAKNSVNSSIDTWVSAIEATRKIRKTNKLDLKPLREKMRLSGQTCWRLEQLFPRRLTQGRVFKNEIILFLPHFMIVNRYK